jgi:hypothetical protein
LPKPFVDQVLELQPGQSVEGSARGLPSALPENGLRLAAPHQ